MKIFTKRVKRILIAAVFVMAVTGAGVQGLLNVPSSDRTFFALDTIIRMTAFGRDAQQALDAAEKRINEIDAKFSAFRPESQIYKLNEGLISTVDDEVFSVLSRALTLCEATQGSFDITLKPISDLWDITGDHPRVPSQEELAEALGRTGYQNVLLDQDTNRVTFLKKGMALDLGGIVKGYASDEAVRVMKELGVENAYLDLGGNVAVMGEMPLSGFERLRGMFSGNKSRPFRVGIQSPDSPRGTAARVIETSNQFIVTSGDYERYFEQDGERYHHIFDPKTGWPAKRGVHSVTILADSGLEADALSTAIFVDPHASEAFQVGVIELGDE